MNRVHPWLRSASPFSPLFSAKEPHRFLILNILRPIHDGDNFPERTDRILAQHHMPSYFF
jgi:hypothetical protein